MYNNIYLNNNVTGAFGIRENIKGTGVLMRARKITINPFLQKQQSKAAAG